MRLIQRTLDTEGLIKGVCEDNKDYAYFKNKDGLVVKRIKGKGRNCRFEFPLKVAIPPVVIGLIDGEGHLSNRSFIFANSNPDVIKQVYTFMLQFKIDSKNYIEICAKNTDNKFQVRALKFWESLLNSKMGKVRVRGNFFNTTQYGTLHISYNNAILVKFLKKLILESKKEIEQNNLWVREYMKGIFAAEGNVNVKKQTKCVYQLRISAKREGERKVYKKFLERLGIKIYCEDMKTVSKEEGKLRGWKTEHGRAGAVIISRWINFIKMLELGLLDLHKEKKDKFCVYFKNNKLTRSFLTFRHFKGRSFDMSELKKDFNLSTKPRERMDRMVELGFVQRIKERSKWDGYRYVLTKKYLDVYDKLKGAKIF